LGFNQAAVVAVWTSRHHSIGETKMEELPEEKTLAELVEMGKSFEDQTRKLYEMAEAFAQKSEKRLHEVRLAPDAENLEYT